VLPTAIAIQLGLRAASRWSSPSQSTGSATAGGRSSSRLADRDSTRTKPNNKRKHSEM